MKQQLEVTKSALTSGGKTGRGTARQIAEDVYYRTLVMVNVVFIGEPGARDREWLLVDTGLAGTGGMIARAAAQRFGKGSRPCAIILTHGHFDHVGSLETLAEKWEAPVYAHRLELPFLNGTRAYPPPDPMVGGGIMATLSPLYPREPVDVSRWLRTLPENHDLPGLKEWKWIPTPGHTEGHVSLWRERDRLLIAGDAFITTRQESAYAVARQKPEMHGPPMYFTPDWERARESVQMLALLAPETVVTGHGRAMRGPEMRHALNILARDFDRLAFPQRGG